MLKKLLNLIAEILGYEGTTNNVNDMFAVADQLEETVDKLLSMNRHDEAKRIETEIKNSISNLQYHLMVRLNEITAKGGDFIEK